MSKSLILSNIKKLAEAIESQQSNIHYLNKGISISREDMRTKQSCSFFSWFRDDGKYLKEHVNGQTLEEVVALHSHWFSLYEKVYTLFYGENKKIWFLSSSMPKKLNEMEKAKLEAYLNDIEDSHKPLLRKLDILAKRVEQNTHIDNESYKEHKSKHISY